MVMLWKSGEKGLTTKLSFHEESILLVFSTTWRIDPQGDDFVSKVQTCVANEMKEWRRRLRKRTDTAVNLNGSSQFLVSSAIKTEIAPLATCYVVALW